MSAESRLTQLACCAELCGVGQQPDWATPRVAGCRTGPATRGPQQQQAGWDCPGGLGEREQPSNPRSPCQLPVRRACQPPAGRPEQSPVASSLRLHAWPHATLRWAGHSLEQPPMMRCPRHSAGSQACLGPMAQACLQPAAQQGPFSRHVPGSDGPSCAGTIPASLVRLPNVRTIDLKQNRFSALEAPYVSGAGLPRNSSLQTFRASVNAIKARPWVWKGLTHHARPPACPALGCSSPCVPSGG